MPLWIRSLIFNLWFSLTLLDHASARTPTPTITPPPPTTHPPTVIFNQYVSMGPECLSGNRAAACLCCVCICEDNCLKFGKRGTSLKWWMPVKWRQQNRRFQFNNMDLLGAVQRKRKKIIWAFMRTSRKHFGSLSGKISWLLDGKMEEKWSLVSPLNRRKWLTLRWILGRNNRVVSHPLRGKFTRFKHIQKT